MNKQVKEAKARLEDKLECTVNIEEHQLGLIFNVKLEEVFDVAERGFTFGAETQPTVVFQHSFNVADEIGCMVQYSTSHEITNHDFTIGMLLDAIQADVEREEVGSLDF